MRLDPKTFSRILAVLVPERRTDQILYCTPTDAFNFCRDVMLENIETKSSQILSEIEKALEEKNAGT